MRVIFMGTPEFSVGTFKAIRQAGHEIVLAVTQPDRPRGRGKSMQYPPIKEVAMTYGIPVFQPEKIRETEQIEHLKDYPAEVMVVVAFGQILPKEVLEMTPYGCINVHASLLPKYRGAAPIQWAIIDGEEFTGVTTMQMDEGLDTGDILLEKQILVIEEETGGSLHDKLSKAGAELCVETLEKLEAGTVQPRKQGESTTHYASMLKKEMGKLDFQKDGVQLERLIRGLSPWPGTYTTWDKKTVKIWKAALLDKDSNNPPGTVLVEGKRSFGIQTGNGILEIIELQLPGKKRMTADAFLRGYTLETGMKMGL